MPPTIHSLVIVDNQPVAIRGIRQLLKDSPDFQVIGEATEGLQAVETVRQLKPRFLILDLELPGLIGFEVAKRIAQVSAETQIIIYSGHCAWPYVRKAFQECGASGFVHKDDNDLCLLEALNAVLNGKPYMSPSVMSLPQHEDSNIDLYLKCYDMLTDTEKELLQPLAEGYTAAQIAALRSVEETTIRTHLENMKSKLSILPFKMTIDNLRRIARVCLVLGKPELPL
jgi:DNA-binding NarL/FixJ family response regulator